MKLIWLNARLQFEELIHLPAFAVPSMGMPLLTYVIFGLPGVRNSPQAAAAILVSFAAFATLGIVMFQFGVGIAADRGRPWERFVRTLPTPAGSRFAARLLVSVVFSLLALVPLIACAAITSPLQLGPAAWLRIGAALLLGAVPLGLLGIMLGYLLNERGALPVTNLIYLPLSYAGGLFGSSTQDLPKVARTISPWLPTRQWSDVLMGFGLHATLPIHQMVLLIGYGAAFAALAIIGYRRDEQRQYR